MTRIKIWAGLLAVAAGLTGPGAGAAVTVGLGDVFVANDTTGDHAIPTNNIGVATLRAGSATVTNGLIAGSVTSAGAGALGSVTAGSGTVTNTLAAGTLTEGGNAVPNVTDHLGVFGATTSAQLRSVLSDESGTGPAVFAGGNIGAATATTPSASDNSTNVATTAYVRGEIAATQTGTHISPSTTNPLSPTWTSPAHTVWYGATGTINLPAVASYAGKAILIYNTGAFTITIDPNGSEVVVRDGNVQTGGVSFTLSSGAGNYVAIWCDGSRWITLGYKGTLTVGS